MVSFLNILRTNCLSLLGSSSSLVGKLGAYLLSSLGSSWIHNFKELDICINHVFYEIYTSGLSVLGRFSLIGSLLSQRSCACSGWWLSIMGRRATAAGRAIRRGAAGRSVRRSATTSSTGRIRRAGRGSVMCAVRGRWDIWNSHGTWRTVSTRRRTTLVPWFFVIRFGRDDRVVCLRQDTTHIAL